MGEVWLYNTGTHVPQWDSNRGRKDHQIFAPSFQPLRHAGKREHSNQIDRFA
jgi:hypothetical protein